MLGEKQADCKCAELAWDKKSYKKAALATHCARFHFPRKQRPVFLFKQRKSFLSLPKIPELGAIMLYIHKFFPLTSLRESFP